LRAGEGVGAALSRGSATTLPASQAPRERSLVMTTWTPAPNFLVERRQPFTRAR
jgi:hypothetical protein